MRAPSAGTLFVFAGCLLALPVPAAAFRTGADLSELAGTERVRWPSTEIPFALHVDGAPGAALADVERAVVDAVSFWGALECGGPRFRYLGITSTPPSPTDGIVTIRWLQTGWLERGYPADSAGTTELTYGRPGDAEAEAFIADADIYLDGQRFRWSPLVGEASSDVRSITTVVRHEALHALGLLHCCESDGRDGAPLCTATPSCEESIMWPWYVGHDQAASADDVAGACFLYPTEPCETTGCAPGSACTAAGCRITCADTVCGAGEVCAADACQPALCGGEPCPAPTPDPPAGRGHGELCATAEDCASSYCGSDGYCSAPCTAGVACPSGFECVGSECIATLGVFGDDCAYSSDCLTGLCLEGAEPAPVCTQPCMGGESSCPRTWVCGSVDSRAVCRPPPQGGCSIASTRASTAPSMLALLILALVGRRRR